MESLKHKIYGNSGNPDVLNFIKKPGLVLDVGCGRGDNARLLTRLGCTVDGITISPAELETAAPSLRKGFLYDLEKGLPPEIHNIQYDYIICSHVLEHICYPSQLLNNIRQCLKNDGMLIVALPNLFHYNARIKLLKGEFEYQPSGLWDDTHFRWYSYKSGRALLEKHGFAVKVSDVTGTPPLYSLLSKILDDRSCEKFFKLCKKLSPGLFGYQLLYAAALK